MLLSEILKGVGIVDTKIKNAAIKINKITADSRTAESGDVFVCIRGEHHDGHDYIDEAFANGVVAVIVDRDTDVSGTVIKVRDTRKAFAVMCSNYYGRPQNRLKIIAVTGTNGKTSITYMLRAIYEEAGHNCALVGTVTHDMTTPLPDKLYPQLREFVDNGVEYVFMEASSHALALGRLEGIKFQSGIFTNLTPEHMDFHITMEDYLQAKAILFRQCETGFFNYDDDYSLQITELADCKTLFYSAVSDEADYTAKNIVNFGVDGIRYEFLTEGELFRICSPIPGMFTVYNTLAAIACAYHDNVPPSAIRVAVKKLYGVPGRLERVGNDRGLAVFIDYAHTPDALENVLKALREIKATSCNKGRLTVLFGCGGDRDSTKRPIMGRIASKLADFTIITSDNSRTENPQKIINDIMKGIDKELPHIVIENRANAIKYAIDTAGKHDIILLAGKGHENYEITADGKHPFSEKELVRKFTSAEGK